LNPIQNELFYYFYNDYPSIKFAIPATAVIYAFGKVFVDEWLKGKISGWKIAGVLYLVICVIVFVAIYPSSHNNDSNPSGYYVNCDDARVQGADLVYSDDPGYISALDRDGDGVGCDKW
jgi:hypothetical protein